MLNRESENKIPSISSSVTTLALTAVENKIPDVSSLLKKKTDYDTKIRELEKKLLNNKHDKYVITLEFNKLTAKNFATRLAQVNWVIS